MTNTEPNTEPGRWARLVALGRLGQGGAGRHVAQLGGGTAVVMVVGILAQLVMGFLYTEQDYGVFSNLVSFATVVAMLATLRLEMAIPLADDEQEADDLARLALVLASGLSLVLVPLALVVTLVGEGVPPAFRVSVQVAPFVVWSSAGFAVLRGHLSRRQQFRQISDANVAGSLATAGAQLGLGQAGFKGSGLSIGYGLGRLLSTAMMLRASGLPLRGPVRFGLLRRWSQIPTWTLVPAMLNALTVGGVAMVMTALYGVGFAGQFGFVQRLLSMPVALLGQAVASVFYTRFAAMHRAEQDTSRHMVRLARVLLWIGLVIFVPITLLGREAFVLAWPDHKWETAGYISGILAPWLMVNFVSSPLSGYATVKNEVRRLFALAWLEAGVRFPALALGLFVGGPMLGVQVYSLAGLAICLYWTIWVMRLSGASTGTAWRVVAWPLLLILAAWGFSLVGRDALGMTGYVACALAVSASAAVLGGVGVVRALRA